MRGPAGQSSRAPVPFGLVTRFPRGPVTGVIQHLLANPVLLVPILLVAAMMVYALLKKLLKIAAILAIAGVLYVVLMRYVDGGGL